jgi:hypothetical protein
MSLKRARKSKARQQADPVVKRLDALIRLFIEINKKPDSKKEFTETDAARILKSLGLTPTEIAKILGKESATDVAPYLYPKKKSAAPAK